MVSKPFPVVGIGASAGGIEALEGFFRGLPDAPGLALVVVTHLSPERESVLHEIIRRYTGLDVHIAADGVEVAPNQVYVLPADAILSIEGGRLRIAKPARSRRERKPIDIFFSALAVDQGEMAAGVVLSGGDSDGTLGIKVIKERGGLTLAQVRDGYGPNHPDMPDSAIATGLVDFAVPADEMGAKLAAFARDVGEARRTTSDPASSSEDQSADQVRPEIYAVLRNQVGHDFSGYKAKTFLRRVQRRMMIAQVASPDAYVEWLRQDPQEVAALFRDLLINVTSFFRDADAFKALAETVIPKLFEGRGADDTVRVWVPGCATGEEVFSLGILLREYMEQRSDALPRVQVFATDIDERSLAVARAARYPAGLLDSVEPARRERFFIADGGGFLVSKDVRDLCIFSPHSVIRDPPFSRIDLVSCRNLLIYFGADVQNQVIPTFHYALRPEGYLFLGTSENVSAFEDLFEALDKKHRLFRRRVSTGPSLRLPLMLGSLRAGNIADLVPRRVPPLGAAVLRQSVENQVMERFAPPHVVVNRDGDIVYYSGRTGKYLEAAAGAPTRQLVNLARKGLRLEIRTLFREAVESGRPVGREAVAVEDDSGRVQVINLMVEPLSQSDGNTEPLFLILFLDQGPVLSRDEALGRGRPSQEGRGAEQAERELRDTRERLQSMIEEYETALEELKSSNEELVSLNEELQSTNEELEASKEEQVSLNEELHTVNAELINKVDALDRANSDLQNLFESTDVATVFLDKALTIRSFTPAMAQVFNILPNDRGRPITDLSSRFSLPDFANDIAGVLAGRGPVERVADDKGRGASYLLRITPYRDGDQRPDGVVISFMDVTGLKQAEARQDVLIAELQHRTRNLLGVVRNLADRSFPPSAERDEYDDRLAALSRVQGFLSRAPQTGAPLADLIAAELAALIDGASDRVTVTGPPVTLSGRSVQVVALALHELATNAVKYGAIAQDTGRLAITWAVEAVGARGTDRLVIDWRESGVTMPEGASPSRRGYGSELITEALPYQLRAEAELVFEPDGVRCRIVLPDSAFGAEPGASRE